MSEVLHITHTLYDSDVQKLVGYSLQGKPFDVLISGRDVDVYKPDGTLLLMFRHEALPPGIARLAFPDLRKAAVPGGSNRSTAAGGSSPRIRLDGSVSTTTYALPWKTGQVGFLGSDNRNPQCRETAFTRKDVTKWAGVLPFARAVNDVFQANLPDRHAAQMSVVERTVPDFVIPGTAFTTITVNRNWPTAVHTDVGDLPEGFGVMSVLRAGDYDGCFLVFPKFRVAVDMNTRDVLLADVHEHHGNTPLQGTEGEYDRVTTVLYYQTKMQHCRRRK